MAAKSKKQNPFVGCWSIVSMSTWDEDYLNEEVQAFIEFDNKGGGSFQFGYVQGVQEPDSDWVDGTFGPATKDAVEAWQHDKWEAQTTKFGEVWPDDWTRLHKVK